jgi:hypothetical protein
MLRNKDFCCISEKGCVKLDKQDNTYHHVRSVDCKDDITSETLPSMYASVQLLKDTYTWIC